MQEKVFGKTGFGKRQIKRHGTLAGLYSQIFLFFSVSLISMSVVASTRLDCEAAPIEESPWGDLGTAGVFGDWRVYRLLPGSDWASVADIESLVLPAGPGINALGLLAGRLGLDLWVDPRLVEIPHIAEPVRVSGAAGAVVHMLQERLYPGYEIRLQGNTLEVKDRYLSDYSYILDLGLQSQAIPMADRVALVFSAMEFLGIKGKREAGEPGRVHFDAKIKEYRILHASLSELNTLSVKQGLLALDVWAFEGTKHASPSPDDLLHSVEYRHTQKSESLAWDPALMQSGKVFLSGLRMAGGSLDMEGVSQRRVVLASGWGGLFGFGDCASYAGAASTGVVYEGQRGNRILLRVGHVMRPGGRDMPEDLVLYLRDAGESFEIALGGALTMISKRGVMILRPRLLTSQGTEL